MQHLDPYPCFFENKNDPVNTRFLTNPNPNENDKPSVYACLPGEVSLNDIEHCAPNNNSDAALVLKNIVFYGGKFLETEDASVCWLSRCSATAFQKFFRLYL